MPDQTKQPDPFAAHREVWEELWQVQQRAAELTRELELRRKDVIEHVCEKLKRASGIKERVSELAEKGALSSPIMAGTSPQNADPIRAFVLAAESNYFNELGGNKPMPPLAIYHVNDWSGGAIECPHCGEQIDHNSGIKPPDGTVGRGGQMGLAPGTPQ
jgi:hypothetical protein